MCGVSLNFIFSVMHVYCICHIFRESNFSRIGTSRYFREGLNSRSRKRAIMDGGQRTQYHSLICMCTV